jgi:hypothetical protein
MDDQARAVLLSLSKVVQNEDESVTTEEKIKAIVGIGHSLCCGRKSLSNRFALLFISNSSFTSKELHPTLYKITCSSIVPSGFTNAVSCYDCYC